MPLFPVSVASAPQSVVSPECKYCFAVSENFLYSVVSPRRVKMWESRFCICGNAERPKGAITPLGLGGGGACGKCVQLVVTHGSRLGGRL